MDEFKPYYCTNCHTSLGHTKYNVLQIANVLIHSTIVLECNSCHARRKWKPTEKEAVYVVTPIPKVITMEQVDTL